MGILNFSKPKNAQRSADTLAIQFATEFVIAVRDQNWKSFNEIYGKTTKLVGGDATTALLIDRVLPRLGKQDTDWLNEQMARAIEEATANRN